MISWKAIVPFVLALCALAPRAHAQASDTVTVGSRLPFSLEPHVLELIARLVNDNVFDTLVHRGPRHELEPALATSWRVVTDTVLEFKLRRGVKFHNGDALTPEDVKFSVERTLDPSRKLTWQGQLRGVKEVQVLDGETLRLVTEKPFPALLPRLAGFFIVPRKHVEKVGDQAFAAGPVGTGPWRFVEWKRDQHIRLEAFDGHWRGRPPFRHLVFRGIPDVSTRLAELKTGGIDLVWWPPGPRRWWPRARSGMTPTCLPIRTSRRRRGSSSPRPDIRTEWTSRCTAPAARISRSSRPWGRC